MCIRDRSTGAMLNVEPGDRVLDLCAAPGGKSTQVAAKLKGQGIIVSNDISASRCKALLKNIEVSGVPVSYTHLDVYKRQLMYQQVYIKGIEF